MTPSKRPTVTFQHLVDQVWGKLFSWNPPLGTRVLLCALLVATGFFLAYYFFETTGTYFTFISLLTVVLISLFAEMTLILISSVVLSVLGDYFFLPPLRGLFENRTSYQHFFLLMSACLIAAFVVSSLRSAFQRVTVLRGVAEDAKREAEEANSAKSAFLANMSHEIRTPLGAVIGFAELIGDARVGPSEKANYVTAIRRNGDLLANIINDILDLSKVEAGKMTVDIRETALTEVLSDTKMLLGLQAKEKGIALNVIVEKTVPAIFNTDPLRLRQVLMNVVGNAIKFTEKGSVDITIRRFETESRPRLEFSVKDSGCGIEPTQIGKLFATFSRANSSTYQKKGIGLGLVLSKRLANLLGGDVVLTQSDFGIGSTFTVTIDPGPMQGALYNTMMLDNVTPIAEIGPKLEGMRILLADDSPDNQTLIGRILNLSGAAVDMVSNGKEAVERAMSSQYDVLLMDLQMPVMDGFEATLELRRKGYRGKIIALTAHALNEDKSRCLACGFDGHLGKPVNRMALVQELSAE